MHATTRSAELGHVQGRSHDPTVVDNVLTCSSFIHPRFAQNPHVPSFEGTHTGLSASKFANHNHLPTVHFIDFITLL